MSSPGSSGLVARLEAAEASINAKMKDIVASLLEPDERIGTVLLYPRNEINDWNAAHRKLSNDLKRISGITIKSTLAQKKFKRFTVSVTLPFDPTVIFKTLDPDYSVRFASDFPVCTIRCIPTGSKPIPDEMASEIGKVIGNELFVGAVRDNIHGVAGAGHTLFFSKWPTFITIFKNLRFHPKGFKSAILFKTSPHRCAGCGMTGHAKTTCWRGSTHSSELQAALEWMKTRVPRLFEKPKSSNSSKDRAQEVSNSPVTQSNTSEKSKKSSSSSSSSTGNKKNSSKPSSSAEKKKNNSSSSSSATSTNQPSVGNVSNALQPHVESNSSSTSHVESNSSSTSHATIPEQESREIPLKDMRKKDHVGSASSSTIGNTTVSTSSSSSAAAPVTTPQVSQDLSPEIVGLSFIENLYREGVSTLDVESSHPPSDPPLVEEKSVQENPTPINSSNESGSGSPLKQAFGRLAREVTDLVRATERHAKMIDTQNRRRGGRGRGGSNAAAVGKMDH